MLKVNNKKAINNLANKSYKANKLRNLFAIIAIILTTVMFTAIFTIGMNLVNSYEQETMRQVGSSSHGGLKEITKEQYDKISKHPLIKGIGYTVVLGFGENKELGSRQTEIRYTSGKWQAKEMFAMPETGRLPIAVDEVALDTIILDLLGLPYELGQKVTLEYSLNGEPQRDTFTLVGYWEGDPIMTASEVWLSKEYVEDKLKDLDPLKNNPTIGAYNASINFSNSRNIEENLKTVIEESGYDPAEMRIGINWAYMGTKSYDMGTILGVSGALLLIILCGYLIISNIFLISVSRDIRFYGLLKTIGTTGKQLRKLIRKQALKLCFVGIPAGLLLGYGVGVYLTPAVMSILTINRVAVSANPVIFIGSAVFAAVTVFISTAKAERLAGKVSPIEALRSSESVSMKKTTRKSGGVNIPKMGLANVFRSKKKATLVIISLSLSLIILNATFSIVNSFDLEQYISTQIDSDFIISDVSRGNFTTDFSKKTVPESVLADISAQKGIEVMSNVYFSEQIYPIDDKLRVAALEAKAILDKEWKEQGEHMQRSLDSGSAMAMIYGVDRYGLEKIKMFSDFDYDKFISGNYVIAAPFFSSGKVPPYNIGDKVTLEVGEGKTKEYEVLGIGGVPYNMSAQHSFPIGAEFILPEGEYLSQKIGELPMITLLEAYAGQEQSVEDFLEGYVQNNKDIKYKSKAIVKAEFENLQKTYLLVGGILSFIMAFIGIMNFINTMITSVIARRRELAMLQSIGMTGKQLGKMLVSEGLTYTVLTAAFVLSIGSAIGYALVYLMAGGTIMFSPSFSVMPVVVCLPILVVVAIIVPLLCYKAANRDSIVERLREVE